MGEAIQGPPLALEVGRFLGEPRTLVRGFFFLIKKHRLRTPGLTSEVRQVVDLGVLFLQLFAILTLRFRSEFEPCRRSS